MRPNGASVSNFGKASRQTVDLPFQPQCYTRHQAMLGSNLDRLKNVQGPARSFRRRGLQRLGKARSSAP